MRGARLLDSLPGRETFVTKVRELMPSVDVPHANPPFPDYSTRSWTLRAEQKMWRDDRKGYEETVRRSVREQLGL